MFYQVFNVFVVTNAQKRERISVQKNNLFKNALQKNFFVIYSKYKFLGVNKNENK